MKNLDLKRLKKFLFEANKHGYAGNPKEIASQRPGFEELEYAQGDWYFRDSYSGHYFAPGQEVVYFKGEPVWAMAYAGEMRFGYHGKEGFAHQTFAFLKEALLTMDPEKPYRGPKKFEQDDWRYESKISGDVRDFTGNEKIYLKNKIVFEQSFIGGVIVK